MDHLMAFANTDYPEHAGACECVKNSHVFAARILDFTNEDFYATVSEKNARKWGWL